MARKLAHYTITKAQQNAYQRCRLCEEVYRKKNIYQLDPPVKKWNGLPVYSACKPCITKLENK